MWRLIWCWKMNKKFDYNKTIIYIAALMLIIILLIVLYLIKDIEDWKIVSYLILVLILAVLIVILFLIGSSHEITDKYILINTGLLFRGKIPIENVKSVAKVEKKPFRFGLGVYFIPFRKEIYVITLTENLVSITLKNPQRFGFGALGKKAREIIFNVDKPKEFVECVKEKIGQYKKKENIET